MSKHNNHSTALADRLAAGHESAFAELLDSLGPQLHRAAGRMLNCSSEADDVVQECFVDLVRGRHNLHNVTDLNGYVFRVLFRAASRHLKRKKSHDYGTTELGSVADPHSLTPESRSDNTDYLEHALRSLPTAQREVLVMKIDAGMTFQEIGTQLGVSINTAASRYRYAIETLKVKLVET